MFFKPPYFFTSFLAAPSLYRFAVVASNTSYCFVIVHVFVLCVGVHVFFHIHRNNFGMQYLVYLQPLSSIDITLLDDLLHSLHIRCSPT